MGATEWMVFVPYEADFGEALWRARRAVFEAGDYQPPYGMTGDAASQLTDEDVQAAMAEFVGVDPSEFAGIEEAFLADVQPPAARDELDEQIGRMLSMTMDQGSHSILDMARVGSTPGFGVVVPVDPEDLERIVGTAELTRSQVEEAKLTLLELRPRWEGSVVVVHDQDGKPAELCFLGYSGD